MIYMQFPGVPPSVNSCYITARGGRRVLSPEGRRFKTEKPAYLTQHYRKELLWLSGRKNKRLTVLFHFIFEQLENKGYPKETDNRFKRLDATNCVKLVEDVLAKASGIDDSHNFTVVSTKEVGDGKSVHLEQTLIRVWSPDEEPSPIDEAIRSL